MATLQSRACEPQSQSAETEEPVVESGLEVSSAAEAALLAAEEEDNDQNLRIMPFSWASLYSYEYLAQGLALRRFLPIGEPVPQQSP